MKNLRKLLRYRIVVVFGNTNVNVENDRKHCALQISREYFGACLPRHKQADKELADSFESFDFEFARTIYEFRV